jgi:BlaI family transcriptional regulator, penicillinase repressor
MPRSIPRLGNVQLQIMQVLWRRGPATAREITDALAERKPIALSTVQTLLRQMEAKGAVAHESRDRVFVFRPLFEEPEVAGGVTHDLLDRVFNGSVYGMVSYLLRHERVSPDELRRLRALIDEEEQK